MRVTIKFMDLNSDLQNKVKTAQNGKSKNTERRDFIVYSEIKHLQELFKADKNILWKFLQRPETSRVQK